MKRWRFWYVLRRLVGVAFSLGWLAGPSSLAHDLHGHRGPTYEVTDSVQVDAAGPSLELDVRNRATGLPTAARFSLVVDGTPYTPAGLGPTGLRFVSIHQGKNQRSVILYARGNGPVHVPLPADAQAGKVFLVKGFEYFPREIPFQVVDGVARLTVSIERWSNLGEQGWLSAEEHAHYDRIDPAHDMDWLTMLAGDDLDSAHFLVLKGGNLPGVWAEQFAYGPDGEARDDRRLIRPGEEYRDGIQGHINLLGIREMIPPISTGRSDHPYHYPTFFDVFQRARELGGIGGPAHGTASGRSPTGIVDTVLGAVDFFEIANTHLYKTDVWYRLMNCGHIVPPAAGTDLPNFPYRDHWQPLLGEVRMYVRVGAKRDFDSWKEAVLRGEVFVSSGPMITFTIDGIGPGGTVRLPAEGGEVVLKAELSSPRSLENLEIVQNGKVIPTEVRRRQDRPVSRWTVRQPITITRSSWLAGRGVGVPKVALKENLGIEQNTFAHTGAIRVLVGEQPITSADDARLMIEGLTEQKEFYRKTGKYERPEHRDRALQLFDLAIEELQRQVGD